MRLETVIQSTIRKVSGTVRSPDNITAATPTIALHDNTGTADTWLPAAWSTTPALDTDPRSSTYGLYVGVAETSTEVDFSTKPLGTYIVRAKAGTVPVNCYALKVIP